MEQISILKVLKPQGLKGEMKCQPLTENTDIFSTLKSVICDNKELNIISSIFRLGYVYICVENCNSINDAEKFRNKIFYISKADYGELKEDTFFIEDLEGCAVFNENGEEIGEIIGIENYGATDILEIKDKWRTYMLPFVKKAIISVDIQSKKVIVNEEVYKEIRT